MPELENRELGLEKLLAGISALAMKANLDNDRELMYLMRDIRREIVSSRLRIGMIANEMQKILDEITEYK